MPKLYKVKKSISIWDAFFARDFLKIKISASKK